LVVPVLFLLVFGIVDYGRFFFDSVSLRQGAREGALQAVVQLYGGCTGASFGAKIACSAKAATDTTMGTPKVYIPAVPTTVVAGVNVAWAQGKQLLVCMASKENGTGFVPFPAKGMLRTKVYMSIEVGLPVVDPTYSAEADPDTDATTGNWKWCK
jgi:Flp pilus assembly protein TadG